MSQTTKTMNCEDYKKALTADPGFVEESGHVDSCASCQEYSAELLQLDENIAATARVAKMAHEAGIPVEGELGAVLGHEAGPLPPYEELFASGRGFTDPQQAERFVKESKVDWLSVAFGDEFYDRIIDLFLGLCYRLFVERLICLANCSADIDLGDAGPDSL